MITRLLNKIKSIYVNFKVFPPAIAKKMPIYISYRTKCEGLYKGCIEIQNDSIEKSMILIGLDTISFGINGSQKSYVMFQENSKLIVHGIVNFTEGISLCLYKNAIVDVGKDFFANGYCTINAYKYIRIGEHCTFGWRCLLLDSDGHAIWNENKERINVDQAINIGDNVWLAAETAILKGAYIKNGCVVGYGSIVTGKNENEKAVLVGRPAKETKQNVEWEK